MPQAEPAPYASMTLYTKLDPDWLRDQYLVQGRGMKDIARLLHLSHHTVRRALAYHHIPIRDQGTRARPAPPRPVEPRLYHNPAWLVHKHHLQGLSLTEMAAEAGISQPTITDYMQRRGIEVLHWTKRQAIREQHQARHAQTCPRTCPHKGDCLEWPPETVCPLP